MNERREVADRLVEGCLGDYRRAVTKVLAALEGKTCLTVGIDGVWCGGYVNCEIKGSRGGWKAVQVRVCNRCVCRCVCAVVSGV